jgi:hypothetical protein
VDPTTGLDDVEKRKILPLPGLELQSVDRPVRSQSLYPLRKGRAVAQAVSRWLLTAATRVRVLAACGVCGGQSSTGAGFLRVLRFSLSIIILSISPSS